MNPKTMGLSWPLGAVRRKRTLPSVSALARAGAWPVPLSEAGRSSGGHGGAGRWWGAARQAGRVRGSACSSALRADVAATWALKVLLMQQGWIHCQAWFHDSALKRVLSRAGWNKDTGSAGGSCGPPWADAAAAPSWGGRGCPGGVRRVGGR